MLLVFHERAHADGAHADGEHTLRCQSLLHSQGGGMNPWKAEFKACINSLGSFLFGLPSLFFRALPPPHCPFGLPPPHAKLTRLSEDSCPPPKIFPLCPWCQWCPGATCYSYCYWHR